MIFVNGNPFEQASALRYFSFARHALIVAFDVLKIGAGSRVLMPEYICRDLLSSLYAVGAVPVYYRVNQELAPALPPEQWPDADAVLMVDYFGFAQDAVPFERYRARTGAFLIEDNAHGFLSRDEDGRWLGRRGDAGIFSLRKTFWLENGAALVFESAGVPLPAQLEGLDTSGTASIRIRRGVSKLPGGRAVIARAARVMRTARRLLSGHAVPLPSLDAETLIPMPANPARCLLPILGSLDFAAEVARRRGLYIQIEQRVRAAGMTPVFNRLPGQTVPYGLPVYCDDPQRLTRIAASLHLDCFRWPDLPKALASEAPPHYRRLYLVNFL